VAVLPNRIDEALLRIERKRNDRLTIGWAGGASHCFDILECVRGVQKTMDRNPAVDVHLIGADFRFLFDKAYELKRKPKYPIRFTDWSAKVMDYYGKIDFDIGLAPLKATKFAAAKSAIKALEYAALGIPVVASDTGPYSDFVIDGVTGWLVRREHEWAVRLRELINDEAMRTEMGAAAKQQAVQHTIQEHWKDWAIAYESTSR
jgi:glycosyltransferase involved in cell wall biosynthesis